jgi:hypothetical protein
MIACHGGAADHFATFAPHLKGVQVYASEIATEKFRSKGIEIRQSFSTKGTDQDALAEQIAKANSKAAYVLTDVGDPFDIKLQQAFKLHAPHVVRLAYYDNPEPFVPGGYSDVAAQVMKLADKVLFANVHLAKEENHVGLGYFAMKDAKTIQERRASNERDELRKQYGLQDQKVLVYFGGNNTTYFNDAFPAFLNMVKATDLSSHTLVIQQHPGAKKEQYENGKIAQWQKESTAHHAPKLIISTFDSSQAQVMADGALYYQTSMSPQFGLAKIPAIQIGHEKYEDCMVKNNLTPLCNHSG